MNNNEIINKDTTKDTTLVEIRVGDTIVKKDINDLTDIEKALLLQQQQNDSQVNQIEKQREFQKKENTKKEVGKWGRTLAWIAAIIFF